MFRTLILVASLIATPAMAGSFFQWTDSDGTVCFTDDIERIPEAYFDVAVERTWEDLRENAISWTPIQEK